MMKLWKTTLLAMLIALSSMVANAQISATAYARGPADQYFLNLNVKTVDSQIVNKVWIAAITPEGVVYFYSRSKGFYLYDGTSEPEGVPGGGLNRLIEIDKISLHVTRLLSSNIYVGIGTSFQEMMSAQRYTWAGMLSLPTNPLVGIEALKGLMIVNYPDSPVDIVHLRTKDSVVFNSENSFDTDLFARFNYTPSTSVTCSSLKASTTNTFTHLCVMYNPYSIPERYNVITFSIKSDGSFSGFASTCSNSEMPTLCIFKLQHGSESAWGTISKPLK